MDVGLKPAGLPPMDPAFGPIGEPGPILMDNTEGHLMKTGHVPPGLHDKMESGGSGPSSPQLFEHEPFTKSSCRSCVGMLPGLPNDLAFLLHYIGRKALDVGDGIAGNVKAGGNVQNDWVVGGGQASLDQGTMAATPKAVEIKSFMKAVVDGKGNSFEGTSKGHQTTQVLKKVEVHMNSRRCILLMGILAEKGSNRWKNTLVGVALGRKIPLSVIDKNVQRMWNKWGVSEVGYAGACMVFIRFSDDRIFEEILKRGDWSIVG